MAGLGVFKDADKLCDVQLASALSSHYGSLFKRKGAGA